MSRLEFLENNSASQFYASFIIILTKQIMI